MTEPKIMANIGINNKVGSNLTFAVEITIKTVKVVCIKNLDIVFPSFSVIKLKCLSKNPNRIIESVMIKT